MQWVSCKRIDSCYRAVCDIPQTYKNLVDFGQYVKLPDAGLLVAEKEGELFYKDEFFSVVGRLQCFS